MPAVSGAPLFAAQRSISVTQRAAEALLVSGGRGGEAKAARRHFVRAHVNRDQLPSEGVEVRLAALERAAADPQARAGLLGAVAGAGGEQRGDTEPPPRSGRGQEDREGNEAQEENVAPPVGFHYHGETMLARINRTAAAAGLLIAMIGVAPAALAQGSAAPTNLQPLPPQEEGVPWPTLTWPGGPLPDGVADRLDRALALVGERDPKLGETRAVVVIHHGRLVAERYAPGFGPDTPLLSWSMAKSVTHALLGIAVRKGLVDIDKPMGNPRWSPGDPRAAIPWRQWINMTDGQEYHEIGVVDPTLNDAASMLYGRGRRDVAGFAASLPLIHAPGTHWNYNSAGINLIADALTRVFAPNASPAERRARVARELKDELFAPIGMTSAQPEFDPTGMFIGSALVYATARDWARFGFLYLRNGVWDERRVLPEGWVDFARTKTPAENSDVYGAGFWVTPTAGRGKPQVAFAPGGPRDIFLAQGHEGQVVVIVPSKDLVLVRLGLLDDFVGWGALGEWAVGIINLF